MDTWELKRYLRKTMGKSTLYHYLRFLLNKKHAFKTMERYNKSVDLQLLPLMRKAWIKYHWNFEEFFLYNYIALSDEEKYSYVPEYDKNVFCDIANNNVSDLIFHDKWNTFLHFKKYFCREVININSEDILNSELLSAFVEKRRKFIIKPNNAATGRGVEIIDCDKCESPITILREKFNNVGPFVLEELIQQSHDLKEFHPSSVNTVRITTFRYCDNDIEIISPFIKFGQKGSHVDNGGQGGIICSIDSSSGVITHAIDEDMNHYVDHPDTNKKIVGYKIPYWCDAIKLVKELANVIPDVRYVGWDLALTENGWIMVEGNEKGMFIGFQLPTHHGFREDFDRICNKANITI